MKPQELTQAASLLRPMLGVSLDEFVDPGRGIDPEAGIDGGIKRVNRDKGALIADIEEAEQIVDHRAFAVGYRLAAAGHVHGRVEAILPALEAVRAATWAVVAFDHEDLLTSFGQQTRGG